jgi:hypothetical protein
MPRIEARLHLGIGAPLERRHDGGRAFFFDAESGESTQRGRRIVAVA